LKNQLDKPSVSGDATTEDFERRVAEEVERRIVQPSDTATLEQSEAEKQQAIADAVRAAQEAADAQIAEIIATKEKELAELRSGNENVDINARIAEAVQTRETELREAHEQEVKSAYDAALKKFKQPTQEKIQAAGVKHGEKLFNERWERFQEEQKATGGQVSEAEGGQISQEAIDKAVEETKKKKDEEYAEKMQKAAEGARNEAEMRNKLQLGKLQKQVADGKIKIETYEKQFGPLPVMQGVPQQTRPASGTQQIPAPHVTPQQHGATPLFAGQQQPQAPNVLQKLQAGRGGGIPRGRGAHNQPGFGRGGPGQGRGQRLSGQQPPQLQSNQPIQGQRPAVNRPVPATAGSPTIGGPGQQRRQSGQQQSQLPRPQSSSASLNPVAQAFQPGGVKRPRDDEGQAAGQKRTRVANNAENTGNSEQS
jgi:hypothetical protein